MGQPPYQVCMTVGSIFVGKLASAVYGLILEALGLRLQEPG